MDEVAKHIKKGEIRFVTQGRVLNVANSFSREPRGEMANLTFAGKDDSVVGVFPVEEDAKLKSDLIDRN